MKILGINAFHGDSSAAVLVDGQLVAAVEEERFRRVKHWAGFPDHSINFCLDAAGITVRDLDHVAISSDPKAYLLRKAFVAARQRMPWRSIADRLKRLGKSKGLGDHLANATGVPLKDIGAEFHNVEHHRAHIASGLFVSPFDETAILSIDGMGDFTSTVTAAAEGISFQEIDRVVYPHSVGYLYNALTIYLGFPHYGDEYKVMGLAPYGKPKYVDKFRQLISPQGRTFQLNLDFFNHHKKGISMNWAGGSPHVDAFYSDALVDLLGPARKQDEPVTEHHEDLAASLQAVTEEIMFHLANELHTQTSTDNLVLVGGCAMNSVAVGKMSSNTKFRNVFVPPGAADNGTAIGAALHVQHVTLKNTETLPAIHAFWGTDVANEECRESAVRAELPFDVVSQSELLDKVVDAICDGKVVGWFQGNMEFGARALGNRSLLADPRRPDMREIINLKIKFREKFRPFAPSILAEYATEYFELDEPSPFMERVLPIRECKHDEIPAVTHVDGSGRLQTVTREANPLYWSLIDRFRQRTGVPILLNTSLNENEPIVRTPAEAINCFLRTAMDMLVIGNVVVDRANMNEAHGRTLEPAIESLESEN